MNNIQKAIAIILLLIMLYNSSMGQNPIPIKYFSSQSIGVKEGLDGSRIFDIVCDKDGFIWTRTSRSVQYWDGQKFISIDLPIPEDIEITPHKNHGILLIGPNSINHVSPHEIHPVSQNLMPSIIGDSTNDMDNEGVFKVDKEMLHITKKKKTISIPFPLKIKADYIASLSKLNSNKLIVAVNKRIFEFDLQRMKWSYEYRDITGKFFLDNGYCGHIIIDKFGSIWVTTVASGVVKINANPGFTYLGSDRLNNNFVKNLAVNDLHNQVVVAGLKNGIILFDTLGINRQELDIQLPNKKPLNVTGVYHANDQNYIFLNQQDSNIYQIDLSSNKTKVGVIGKLNRDYVYYQSHFKWDDRYIYFGFDLLYKYDIKLNKLNIVKAVDKTRFTSMSRKGDQLVIGGLNKIVVYNQTDNTVKEYPLTNTPYIRGIESIDDSILNLATDAGLLQFDYKKSVIDTLYSKSIIYSLSKDKNGNLWAGTGNGILLMDTTRQFKLFGAEDGIQGLEFNTNANYTSSSGKIYFGGTNGVSAFHPNQIQAEKIPPHLYIKDITSNAGHISYTVDSALVLDHNQNTLSVQMGAIGRNGTYHYSYKIDNGNWVNQEENSNFNFILTSGTYKITFQSCVPFDTTVCSLSQLEIEIKFPWWRKPWVSFGLICLCFFIIMIILKYLENRKTYKLKLEHEYEAKMQQQKINISRDLHDSIGSQLSYLNSSLDNIQHNSPSPNKDLLDLKQYSRGIIQELRDMIWVLHTDKIHLADLHFKILDLIDRIQNSKIGVEIKYHISSKVDLENEIEANTAGHIFKCIQELLHNGIKHSKSKNIHLKIDQTLDTVSVFYKDEGIGFNPESIQQGNGLQNLNTRINECNGTIEIKADNNIGTMINLNFNIDT